MEKKQRINWDINFNKISPTQLPDPYGFNINIVDVKKFKFRVLTIVPKSRALH